MMSAKRVARMARDLKIFTQCVRACAGIFHLGDDVRGNVDAAAEFAAKDPALGVHAAFPAVPMSN